MAELSINSNTLPTPLTAIFPQWLITLTSLTITLTQKTNIVQILTTTIVSYNICHKFMSTYTKIKRKTITTFEIEKNNQTLKSQFPMVMMKFPLSC